MVENKYIHLSLKIYLSLKKISTTSITPQYIIYSSERLGGVHYVYFGCKLSNHANCTTRSGIELYIYIYLPDVEFSRGKQKMLFTNHIRAEKN